MRTSLLRSGASAVALSAFVAFSTAADAASFDVTGTDNASKTIGSTSSTETGTVESGATLSVNGGTTITWSAGSIVLTNYGLIEQTAANQRAINASGSASNRSITFTNSGKVISADDAFRINVNVTSGNIILYNSGTIQSDAGQAIDLNTITAGTATIKIYNYANGVIESLNNDAIRPGQNGTVYNYGTITNAKADPTDDSAIHAGNATNFSVENYGQIIGAHHGVDQNVDGTLGNPSSSTLTVTNYGTITGSYIGTGNGDGDGVDIDFIGTVTNYGTIQGTGAGGVDSGGFANHSEGIAMGGGVIKNYAGGIISGADTAIRIDNGSEGSAYGSVNIWNAGTIQGLGGDAIVVIGNYDDVLTNSGTIDGSIDLGGGTNTLDNEAGGILNIGSVLYVGSGNTVNNAGTISPGGSGTITTTALTGSLVQTSTGTLAIDLNPATNSADRINVSETASLAGSIKLSVAGISISSGTVTVLSAAGGTSHAGLALTPTPVALQASLVYPNANDVQVSYALSFAPTSIGLNKNQTALGNHINASVIADSTKLTSLTSALFSITDASQYSAALNQLSPEIYGDGAVASLYGAHNFGNALLSCRSRDAQYLAVSEDQCLWVSVSGRDLDLNSSGKSIGYSEQAWGVSGGGQVSVAPSYVLGLAFGVEQGNADTSSGASADLSRAYAGLALKHTVGPWYFAGAVFGGTGTADTRRPIDFGGLTTTATGDQTISHLSGRVRVAYQAGGNALYVKPMVDFEATQLWLGSVEEQGGVGALNVASSQETLFSAAPAVEIGGVTRLHDGTLLRPFARVGGVFYSEDKIGISSAFVGAPTGVPGFLTHAQIDNAMGNVGAGLDIVWSDATVIKAQYDGLFGEDTQQHSFGAKASVKF